METDTRTLEQEINEAIAKGQAERDAARRPIPPTAEEQLAALLARTTFNELVGQAAALADVNPRALRHVQREAADIFELKDGELVPRDGETDPGDPLVPLSPRRWLEQLAKTDAYLFAPPGRTQ